MNSKDMREKYREKYENTSKLGWSRGERKERRED